MKDYLKIAAVLLLAACQRGPTIQEKAVLYRDSANYFHALDTAEMEKFVSTLQYTPQQRENFKDQWDFYFSEWHRYTDSSVKYNRLILNNLLTENN